MPPQIEQGAVYLVSDAAIRFVPEDNRTTHDQRYVVVVSGQAKNEDHLWPLVMVIPCSSKTTWRTEFCVQLNAGDGNLPGKSWARVPAIQALHKDDLGDLCGRIPNAKLAEIYLRHLTYLGIPAPPRPQRPGAPAEVEGEAF